MVAALFILVFALMNRARGSRFFDLTGSTTAGRVMATGGMAMAGVMVHRYVGWGVVDWLLLYAWTVPAWDSYWSAAIGENPDHGTGWGIDMMTLRNGLLLPHYALLAWLGAGWWGLVAGLSIFFMGLTYYAAGKLKPGPVILYAELANGAIMGAASALALGVL